MPKSAPILSSHSFGQGRRSILQQHYGAVLFAVDPPSVRCRVLLPVRGNRRIRFRTLRVNHGYHFQQLSSPHIMKWDILYSKYIYRDALREAVLTLRRAGASPKLSSGIPVSKVAVHRVYRLLASQPKGAIGSEMYIRFHGSHLLCQFPS
jgi:hypothetical protein